MKKKTLIELLSYPLAVFVYVVSLFPLGLLYQFSHVMFFLLFYFPGYRKKVVYNNLSKAFPDKNTEERIIIRRKFYRHLSNLIVETVKLHTLSPARLKQRCCFTPEAAELINGYLQKGQSVIMVMGHYGNWEWFGSSIYPAFGVSPIAAYRPLKNRVFDRLMKKLRTRFGTRIAPMKDFPRKMFSLRKEVTAALLIADQTPSKSNAHWVDFLNQDTPVFKGTAKLSRMFDFPLIFCLPRPSRRGYYEVHAKLITENPKEHDEETVSAMHTQALEEEIKKAPEYWLWTHRRWKHERPK